MSFTVPTPAPSRINRSELAVPGSNLKFLQKAPTSKADILFLDLEDSVAPDEKEQARKNVIQVLNETDWNGKTLSLRINGMDTHYMYRDIIDVLEKAPNKLDLIMVPKVGTASDVYALDMLVTQIETATKATKRIGFELIIETALGMKNVDEIAAASKRNESLHFGVADYAASTKARTTRIGGSNPDYFVLTDPDANSARAVHWGDPWNYPLTRMVIAARANGLRAVDGPFGDIRDSDGYSAQARRALALGCEGKWAIHPTQVDLANVLFSPSEAEIKQATRIVEAMQQAAKEGKGAVTLDGALIDIASIKQAEVLLKNAALIAGR